MHAISFLTEFLMGPECFSTVLWDSSSVMLRLHTDQLLMPERREADMQLPLADIENITPNFIFSGAVKIPDISIPKGGNRWS